MYFKNYIELRIYNSRPILYYGLLNINSYTKLLSIFSRNMSLIRETSFEKLYPLQNVTGYIEYLNGRKSDLLIIKIYIFYQNIEENKYTLYWTKENKLKTTNFLFPFIHK